MKKLFYKPVVLLFSISLLFMSCSKEDDNKTVNGNAKVAAYLKSFYKKDYHIGKSVESRTVKPTIASYARTDEAQSVVYEDIKLTEVFVADEDRARGYVVTDKDTNEFLYFADVDRENYKLTTFDADANETLIKNNIDQLQEWASSNKLDFIQLVEQYNYQVSSGAEVQGKFFGWTGWRNVGGCDEGWQSQVNTHYVFGIKNAFAYQEVPC